MTDRWESIPFAALTVALAATALYTLYMGIRAADGLRIGFGVLQGGLCVTMGYEAVALWFRAVPTISKITNQAFIAYPVPWAISLIILMLVMGALTLHFTHERTGWSWQIISLATLAYLTGAWIAVITKWRP